MMNITFLGTGTSHGVPPLDCMIQEHARCKKGVCLQSASDPKHRRTRSSLFVQWNGCAFLIDASLDFRQQALRERLKRIDAVLITHSHADHIGGIPDLRSYTWQRTEPLPVFGSPESIQMIRNSYAYIFDPDTFVGGGIPHLRTNEITGPCVVAGNRVIPVPVRHGSLRGCFGYRLGDLVYIPDLKSIDEDSLALCRGAKLLVINCLRDEREHLSHLILPQSKDLARNIAPQQCLFVHMCHDIHYEIDGEKLEPWMGFAYDGLRVEL
ncbi:MAG: MBL fold metallo-hydrolase [Chitinispirillaceae bacterium]|nr:MBL fold metallo-hydrolase [Chitinispirillaceae bacterium]